MKGINESEINKLISNHLIYLNETLVAGENVSAGDFVVKTTDKEKLSGNLSNDIKYLYKLTDFTKSGKALIVNLEKIDKWRNSTNVERVLMSKEINLDDYDVIEVEDEYVNFPKSLLDEGRVKSSKTKSGRKVPGKYLTKDKAAMKGEIERVSKLKSDDPDAYGKWEADYKARNKDGKPHKTKKSAATIAYEKKFGKKNENMKKLKENINKNDERYKECWDEIDMRLPRNKEFLSSYEFEEIADTCGLEYEQVTEIFFSYLHDRENKKYEELKDEVKNIFDEIDFYNNNYTYRDFLDYWNENNFHIDYDWVKEFDLKKVFNELVDNPNQTKLGLNEDVDKALTNKAKASGIPKGILRSVYSKGAAAWKSGHRPGVSQQQWAMGRVNSFITGSGGARKADANLWARAKKAKKRKNESIEEELLRKKIREIIHEKFIDDNLDELYPMLVGEDDLN